MSNQGFLYRGNTIEDKKTKKWCGLLIFEDLKAFGLPMSEENHWIASENILHWAICQGRVNMKGKITGMKFKNLTTSKDAQIILGKKNLIALVTLHFISSHFKTLNYDNLAIYGPGQIFSLYLGAFKANDQKQ